MGLTVKDFVATLLVLVTGWIWYAQSVGPLKTLNTRWILVMLLVVGIIMCSQGAPPTSGNNLWVVTASVLGGAAFLVAIWGLITGLKITVTIYVAIVTLLWFITTVRHLFKL